MSDQIVITEQMIRRADPAGLQAVLISAIDEGTLTFLVEPEGRTPHSTRPPGNATPLLGDV